MYKSVISAALFASVQSKSAVLDSDFIWGVAGASYQVEGGWNEGGRQPSIWDTFCHDGGHVAYNETGDVADDVYHRYKEDIATAAAMGVKSYRMSISWSRVMSMDSDGTPESQKPNQEGLAYYDSVINAVLDAGMIPFITMFHWDLPQSVYDVTNGGWINPDIVPYFHEYADLLFSYYGDRIKYWITFNEPWTFCVEGYDNGVHAPGRCSDRSFCKEGDSSLEPYLCAHSVLLCHGDAAELYHSVYEPKQGGVIGMTLNGDWGEPMTDTQADQLASERNMEFQIGWFADPMYFGDYPASMRELVGDRLPVFTAEQSAQLKGSSDYYGMNEYAGHWAANYVDNSAPRDWFNDQNVYTNAVNYNGTLIGPYAESSWLNVVPYAIRKCLNWVADRYGNPPIYVTENGCDCPNENTDPLPGVLNDTFRIDYLSGYLENVMDAMKIDGVNLKGYHVWSLVDNFEWADGYTKRFGLHYVDYDNNLTRYEKQSSVWFTDYIKSNP